MESEESDETPRNFIQNKSNAENLLKIVETKWAKNKKFDLGLVSSEEYSDGKDNKVIQTV